MIKTAVGTDDYPNDGQRGVSNVYHSLTPLERTASQANILRGIIETTKPFLFEPKSATEGFSPAEEARETALRTHTLALAQLNNIIDDMARWADTPSESEKESARLVAAEVKRVQSETRRNEHVTRPFVMLRARILRHVESGKFVAASEGGLHAFGDTPADAAENFDLAFLNERMLPTPPAPQQAAPSSPRKTPRRKK